jgi:hypothetical protein
MYRRALRESSYKLVEEFFRADLKMERISAVLHAYIEEL